MQLTEFILQRIAEDESVAQAAIDAHHPGEWHQDAMGVWPVDGHDLDPVVEYVNHHEARPHIIRHDPARVLAECEAKRVAVDWYLNDDDTVMGPTVRALAAVYADHPDYRDEWG